MLLDISVQDKSDTYETVRETLRNTDNSPSVAASDQKNYFIENSKSLR